MAKAKNYSELTHTQKAITTNILCNVSYLKAGGTFLWKKFDANTQDLKIARNFIRSYGFYYGMAAKEYNSLIKSDDVVVLINLLTKGNYLASLLECEEVGDSDQIIDEEEEESAPEPIKIEEGKLMTFYTEDRIESEEDVLRILNVSPESFYIKQMWIKTKGEGYNVSVMVGVTRGGAESFSAERLVGTLSNLQPLDLVPHTPLPKDASDRFAVLCLFDAHLGKIAYQEYTGNTTSLEEQKATIYNVFQQLQTQITANVKHIVIPIGNDFFNVDDTRLTTTRNTPQNNTSNLYQVFNTGIEFYATVVRELLKNGHTVECILVAGNHAEYSEMILAISLKKLFENNPNVTVDDEPIARKYKLYGKTLLAFAHGTLKPELYAEKLPYEAKQYWAEAEHVEVLLGDKHHEKTLKTRPTQECSGVVVRNLSSTSKTDFWHFNQGYTLSTRRGYVLTYHRSKGIENIYHATI